MCERLDIPLVVKASYDKANRSSIHSFRGPGLEEGLRILQAVKDTHDIPVVTDVHSPEEAAAFAQNWLGKNLVTYQTDENGQPVSKILVEDCTDIADELYLGAVVDREDNVQPVQAHGASELAARCVE